ncbi:hypothetical protein [Solibacillus sp. FSL H8-0538]|uniref:hypothetical protein n=1 Tax=Solibacillus sp. FSL H8-0538 TaxID=2921400 RepID=UPI0030FC237D
MKIVRLLVLLAVFVLASCDEGLNEGVTSDEVNASQQNVEEIELIDNGCYSGEVYIEHEDTCALSIQCSDYESCIAWGNEVLATLEDNYGSLVEEESVGTDDDSLKVIAKYDVDNGDEVIYTDDDVTDEQLEYHADLWFSYAWLIPEDQREDMNKFEVFESGQTLAYVQTHDDYAEYWTLGMNNENIELASETLVTYLHEYAHLLSLRSTEVDYWEDETSCPSLYIEESGCMFEDAYLANFYWQFWDGGGYDELEEYYVSEYAMTSPQEDFAESWAHFVLTGTPVGDSVVEEKILFFYQYEELVELRARILARVATWLVRSVSLDEEV